MSFATAVVVVRADPPCVCGSEFVHVVGDDDNGNLHEVLCDRCGAPGSIFDVLTNELNIDDLDQAQVMIWVSQEATLMEREA